MKPLKRFLSAMLAMLLLLINFAPASAQTYKFQLTRQIVDVFLEEDGTATIEYIMDFLNDPSASPIDFVDVGMPNDDYSLGNINASIDGQPITDISDSPYVDHGFALGLGSNAIQPGQAGTVIVRVTGIKNLLFPSTEKEAEDYASFQFMPNYFDSQFVQGNTYMEVALRLPPGLTENEPRYYPPKNWPGATEPETGLDDQGRVFYVWSTDQASGSARYTFGCSFPARLVPAGVIIKPPAKTIPTEDICCIGGFLGMIVVFGLIIFGGIRSAKKRKLQYLPPKISIEGNGIKRGLTAIEAAILMEQPLDKVLTMILFSTIKKGASSVTSREPLKIDIVDPLPESLKYYEIDFLNAMKLSEKERQPLLSELMLKLVRSVSDLIKGFSRKETVAYYQKIVDQAWDYVKNADTPEVKSKNYEEVMDWTLIDRKYEDRTKDVFRSGPIFVPTWWGRFDPTYRPVATGMGGSVLPQGSGGSVSMPTLPGSDFAVSMVNGVQGFASNLVNDVTSFTGKITDKTNPIPKTTTSSRGGGGRSGGGCVCACACACAGCACACAGGGR